MIQKGNPVRGVNVFVAFTIMLVLYFIVGLFTVINQQFQIPLQTAMLPHDGNITNALVTMLNFSWFLAYPLSQGFGTRWLEKYGYRKTSFLALLILVAGLTIYEIAVLFHIYIPTEISILGNEISVGFFIFLLDGCYCPTGSTEFISCRLSNREYDCPATADDRWHE